MQIISEFHFALQKFIHHNLILSTSRGLVMSSHHPSCRKVSAMRKFTVQRANFKLALPRALVSLLFRGLFSLVSLGGHVYIRSRFAVPPRSHRRCKQKRRRKRKRATQPWKRGQRLLVKIGIRRNRARLNVNKAQANSLRRYLIEARE